MVAEHVAIGNINSPYDKFDLVVNLAYPQNGVKLDEIKHGLEKNSYVFRCGFAEGKDGLTTKKLKMCRRSYRTLKKKKRSTFCFIALRIFQRVRPLPFLIYPNGTEKLSTKHIIL